MNNKLNGLELSLTIGCRLDCDYCPQKLLLEKYYGNDKNRIGKLSFENFRRVLDKVHKGAIISFSGMSEPFHNEECADMILYAYQRGYDICLNTTLVGMTLADYEKIKDVKFKEFMLHIPDNENHSKFVITDEYLKLLKLIIKNIEINFYSCHGTIHDAIKGIIDDKVAKDIIGSNGTKFSDRAGNLKHKDLKGVSIDGRITCYYHRPNSVEMNSVCLPYTMFPDGTLLLCTNDYGMKHVLGNLFTQSWSEICEGEEYKKIIKGRVDDSVDILCRKCNTARKVETLPSMKLKEYVDKKRKGNINKQEFVPDEIAALVDRFAIADNVCVFGLGKLWRDHFYQEYWNEGLGVTVFSDNNDELYGRNIEGIECVSPYELKKYNNLIVVIFVKDTEKIVSQLKALGIDNYILFDEIFNKCNLLYGTKNNRM